MLTVFYAASGMARMQCHYEGCNEKCTEWLWYCPKHKEHGVHPPIYCQEQGCSNTTHEAFKCARCGKLFCQSHLKDNHDGCRIPN